MTTFKTDRNIAIARLSEIAAKGGRNAPFAMSLALSVVKGTTTPKQGEWVDKLCETANEQTIMLPKWVAVARRAGLPAAWKVGRTFRLPYIPTPAPTLWEHIAVKYTSLDSSRANPENRGSISVSTGEYGTPSARYWGRIRADGAFTPGRDCTPEFVAWLQGREAEFV